MKFNKQDIDFDMIKLFLTQLSWTLNVVTIMDKHKIQGYS